MNQENIKQFMPWLLESHKDNIIPDEYAESSEESQNEEDMLEYIIEYEPETKEVREFFEIVIENRENEDDF